MTPREFRRAGYWLVDRVARFLGSLEERPVTRGETAERIREILGDSRFPEQGKPAGCLLEEAADLLFEHSLFNGHPRFWGYITSSPAPIGILADLLAAAVNPNVGAWLLSPMATEIEVQTIRWIAEMIGYPRDAGGLLVSGGNMANFVGFLAARRAKAGWDAREAGSAGENPRLRLYCSTETHTWIRKAAELFGLGTESIRWIPVDRQFRIDLEVLRKRIEEDAGRGDRPFLVIGSAGTVSTGATDPLPELADICRERGVWFHVDGAYGGLAAVAEEAPAELRGMALADSVAVDPHKWLYSPLEAGCALVGDRRALKDAFSHHPPYYRFEGEGINYFECGLQNSRGFRALKVWLGLRQAGRDGYRRMISEDIRMAQELRRAVEARPDLEFFTQSLSIVTFRYAPPDLKGRTSDAQKYLNELNTRLLDHLQKSGEAFVSNALLHGNFVLRACIVNFRTRLSDVRALPELVACLGRKLDREIRPSEAKTGAASQR